ncbi:hypothetical protein AGLY_009740 [Aphis glycines]|uniref:Uncharacterized protein n=1 Tax=Aphis glycines TaxID=307491 RepID=A0A6G0THB3_APHGL|nr:hypothetical protein AGLY_009740 [Aphis glycines]
MTASAIWMFAFLSSVFLMILVKIGRSLTSTNSSLNSSRNKNDKRKNVLNNTGPVIPNFILRCVICIAIRKLSLNFFQLEFPSLEVGSLFITAIGLVIKGFEFNIGNLNGLSPKLTTTFSSSERVNAGKYVKLSLFINSSTITPNVYILFMLKLLFVLNCKTPPSFCILWIDFTVARLLLEYIVPNSENIMCPFKWLELKDSTFSKYIFSTFNKYLIESNNDLPSICSIFEFSIITDRYIQEILIKRRTKVRSFKKLSKKSAFKAHLNALFKMKSPEWPRSCIFHNPGKTNFNCIYSIYKQTTYLPIFNQSGSFFDICSAKPSGKPQVISDFNVLNAISLEGLKFPTASLRSPLDMIKNDCESLYLLPEMRMLRWMSEMMREDRIRNEGSKGVAPIVDKMPKNRSRWLEHVLRKEKT